MPPPIGMSDSDSSDNENTKLKKNSTKSSINGKSKHSNSDSDSDHASKKASKRKRKSTKHDSDSDSDSDVARRRASKKEKAKEKTKNKSNVDANDDNDQSMVDPKEDNNTTKHEQKIVEQSKSEPKSDDPPAKVQKLDRTESKQTNGHKIESTSASKSEPIQSNNQDTTMVTTNTNNGDNTALVTKSKNLNDALRSLKQYTDSYFERIRTGTRVGKGVVYYLDDKTFELGFGGPKNTIKITPSTTGKNKPDLRIALPAMFNYYKIRMPLGTYGDEDNRERLEKYDKSKKIIDSLPDAQYLGKLSNRGVENAGDNIEIEVERKADEKSPYEKRKILINLTATQALAKIRSLERDLIEHIIMNQTQVYNTTGTTPIKTGIDEARRTILEFRYNKMTVDKYKSLPPNERMPIDKDIAVEVLNKRTAFTSCVLPVNAELIEKLPWSDDPIELAKEEYAVSFSKKVFRFRNENDKTVPKYYPPNWETTILGALWRGEHDACKVVEEKTTGEKIEIYKARVWNLPEIKNTDNSPVVVIGEVDESGQPIFPHINHGDISSNKLVFKVVTEPKFHIKLEWESGIMLARAPPYNADKSFTDEDMASAFSCIDESLIVKPSNDRKIDYNNRAIVDNTFMGQKMLTDGSHGNNISASVALLNAKPSQLRIEHAK